MINKLLNTLNKEDFIDLLLTLRKEELLKLKTPFETKLIELRKAYSYATRDESEEQLMKNLAMALLLINACDGSEKTNYFSDLQYQRIDYIERICSLNPVWLVPTLNDYRAPSYYKGAGFGRFYPFVKRGIIKRPVQHESYLIGINLICYHPVRKSTQIIHNEILEDPELVTIDYPQWVRLNAQEHEIDHDFATTVHLLAEESHFEKKPLLEAYLKAIPVARNEVVARQLIKAIEDLKVTPEDYLNFLPTCYSIINLSSASAGKHLFQVFDKLVGNPKFKSQTLLHELPVSTLTKSNPYLIQQLKVIQKIIKNSPRSTFDFLTILSPIFLNTNAKVQELTAKIINSLPKKHQPNIPQSILPYYPSMTGATKKLLEKWLSQEPEKNTTQNQEPDNNPEPTSHSSFHSPPTGAPLTPCENVEDLGFTAAALLSKKGSPQHFDTFLAGFFKFSHTEKDKLIEIFKKQRKSAEKNYSGSHDWGYYPWSNRITAEIILRTIGAELKEQVSPFSEDHEIESTFFSIIAGRVTEILNSQKHHSTLPLLATPETEFGFIEPQTLLDRLKQWSDAKVEILHYDFLQAIARCNIHSNQTLPKIKIKPKSKFEPEPHSVLHYLFTGELPTTSNNSDTYNTTPWWHCAARTREPLAHLSHTELPFILADHPSLSDWQQPHVPYPIKICHTRRIISERQLLTDTPADWLYPRMSFIPDDITLADIHTYFTLAPNHLDQALHITNHYIRENRYSSPFQRTAAAFYQEIIPRQLPMHHPKAYLMVIGMGNKQLHTFTLDLWLQAEELGQVKPNIGLFGDILGNLTIDNGHTINANQDYEKYFDFCPLVIALPCIREIIALGAPFDQYILNIITQALKQQLVHPVTGLAKLLQLYHDLLITYPPKTKIDLNEHWNIPLKGQLKTIANKIAKA